MRSCVAYFEVFKNRFIIGNATMAYRYHTASSVSSIQDIHLSSCYFLCLFIYLFNWNIVELQYHVNFRCTAHLFNYIILQILFPYRLLQNIEYGSLCYTVNPCCLSILYIVVSVNLILLIYPFPPFSLGFVFYVCDSVSVL